MKRLLCAVLAALLLCGCAAAPAETTATTVPVTTSGPVLKPGFYLPSSAELEGTLMYIQLRQDGTGCISLLGMTNELTWTPEGAVIGEMTITPTADGLLADYEAFAFQGDSLPEGYLPEPPTPGVYAVSSVGLDGDVEFYGQASRSNGYFELKDDNTGTLVFDGTEYPFTLDGVNASFDGWSVMLVDASEGLPDGETMVVIYVTDGPLNADSIAFRKLEE